MTAGTIIPADVRAGVARELRHLTDLGITGPEAERRAVAITAAKIRNSPVLVERQAHDARCHHCGGALDDDAPLVAVLQAKGGRHLWMHRGECHAAYGQRRAEMVAGIMGAAGYGSETTGAAA